MRGRFNSAIAVVGLFGALGGIGEAGAIGFGVVAATTFVAGASAMTPDPVFGGTLTSQQQTELMQWGQTYWNRLEGVPTAANTNFTFSSSAMNSPLFNPFYGPRQTLVNLKLIDEQDCMRQVAELPATDAASQAKRGAIKDALVDLAFKTDPVSNPGGTAEHVIKILDASTVAGLVTYTQDGKLVSKKLPLDVLVGAGVSQEFAQNLSADSVMALLIITNQSPAIAQAAAGQTEAQGMLSGTATRADAFLQALSNALDQAGVSPNGIERADALFGVYGQLPLVYVAMNDCAVLVDTTNGSVCAPVTVGSPLDASVLVAAHAESEGSSGAVLMTAAGCLQLSAAKWRAVPPAAPPAPGGFAPYIVPGVWPTNWVCTTYSPTTAPSRITAPVPTARYFCVCEQIGWFRQTPPVNPAFEPFYKTRTTCVYMGACLANTLPGNVPPVNTPSIDGRNPTLVPTCTTVFWY